MKYLPLNKKNQKYLLFTAAIIFLLNSKVVVADVLPPGNINTCGEFAAPGTYTLTQSIGSGGDCILVSSDSVIINGGGFTINGNVTGSDSTGGTPGIGINLQNAVVTGTTTAGAGSGGFDGFDGGSITISTSTVHGIYAGAGGGGYNNSGNGGIISITNSTSTEIVSGSGASSFGGIHAGSAGNGGAITIANSTFGNITSGSGGSSYSAPGIGGSISVTTGILNLLGVTITGGGPTSNLSLSYSQAVTSSTTFAYNISNLLLNSVSYGLWNGVMDLAGFDLSISSASRCSAITFPGVYTLTTDVVGDCHLVTKNVTIDGNGKKITGNVSAAAGVSVSIKNMTVTGTVSTADGVNVSGGRDAGSITISSSTVGTVTSGNGVTMPDHGISTQAGDGGAGGFINVTNSTTSDIVSGNGGSSRYQPGSASQVSVTGSTVGKITSGHSGFSTLSHIAYGGNISISNSTTSDITTGDCGQFGIAGSVSIQNSVFGSITTGNGISSGFGVSISGVNIDLTGKTISLGDDLGLLGQGIFVQPLTITYTGKFLTNNSTYFYQASLLSINGVSYGSWNGLFNPNKYYFNDTVAGAGISGDWSSVANWWTNSTFTQPAGHVPSASDQVYIYGNVTTVSSGSASVSSAIFASSSVNHISVSVSNGATFESLSQNTGTIIGSAQFTGDSSVDAGTVTGTVTRKYIASTTTSRNFTTEGGRNNWIIVADGAPVTISGATYSTSTNIFKAINNGAFVYGANPSGKVVPVTSVISPIAASTTIKWVPNITWDTSATCQYSYDASAITNTINCANNGSDIPHPSSGGPQTLYIQGTDIHGNIAQKSIVFTYDNTSPVYTTCGSDLLDESTRQYYYLNGNVTGDCHASTNVELRGALSTTTIGYTVNGNIIATTTTNGFNITLKNIAVAGSVIASGANNSSGAGYNGGTIDIDPSMTGPIISNGGDGTTQGGNGGTIIIASSTGVLASSTPISAIGGNATYCGYGGSGGPVTQTASVYGVVSQGAGSNMTATIAQGGFCPNPPTGSSGSSGSSQITGQYSSLVSVPISPSSAVVLPPAPSTAPSAPSSASAGVSSGSISPLTPVVTTTEQPINAASAPQQPLAAFSTAVTKVAQQVANTAVVVANSPAGKTVQAAGLFGGLLASVAAFSETAFATPLAASESVLVPARLWGLILMGLGIKKRSRRWGTVYDSVTKQPIDPAFVTVKDESGKIVAESITDIDGRYGFLLPDGKYYISVKKTNYDFPSTKMTGHTSDELYNNLYFGEPITIHAGEVLDKDIPMDQKNFDWNEYIKTQRKDLAFHSRHEKPWAIVSSYVYGIGLVISVIATIVHPSWYNIILLALYVFVFLPLEFKFKMKKLGSITDKTTHHPLSYAIIRVTAFDHETPLRSGVTDANGRYYCIVPKGKCFVDIEKKNADGSYTKVYESSLIMNKTGIINTNFGV